METSTLTAPWPPTPRALRAFRLSCPWSSVCSFPVSAFPPSSSGPWRTVRPAPGPHRPPRSSFQLVCVALPPRVHHMVTPPPPLSLPWWGFCPSWRAGWSSSFLVSVSSLHTHPHQWLPRMPRIRLDPETHLSLCDLPWPPLSPEMIRLASLRKLSTLTLCLHKPFLPWAPAGPLLSLLSLQEFFPQTVGYRCL